MQHRLQDSEDALVPLLAKLETMFYMCGLKGMEFGIYTMALPNWVETRESSRWNDGRRHLGSAARCGRVDQN